jgi:hypothetical protein
MIKEKLMNNFKKVLFFSGFTLFSFITVIDYAVAESIKACCTLYLLTDKSIESICKEDVSYKYCKVKGLAFGAIDIWYAPGVCLNDTCKTDSDGDGTADIVDDCPDDPNKTSPGTCRCGTPDTDSDYDGTLDCNDGCSGDSNKTSPGICGCGNPETIPCETVVTLTSFTTTVSDGKVELKWETASEIDNAGFHIWRSEEKDGEYTKITDTLIPAKGDGSTYTFIDEYVIDGVTYYYKLEDFDLFDVSTVRGPVSSNPAKVLISKPAPNAVFTPDTPPIFEWTEGHYSEFKFQFSDDNGRTFYNIPADKWMQETSITPQAAAWKEYAQTKKGQTILWRVEGKNEQGKAFSEIRSLTIE